MVADGGALCRVGRDHLFLGLFASRSVRERQDGQIAPSVARQLATQSAEAAEDRNAAQVAEALWPLIENGSLKIPRGGYLVRRGRGRIVVEPSGT